MVVVVMVVKVQIFKARGERLAEGVRPRHNGRGRAGGGGGRGGGV